jgi:broad specificity phosphatase PhoE
LRIDIVLSSPLQRAYNTADTIASTLGGKKPEKLNLLIERDFGVMTGKFTKDIESLCSPDIIKSDPIFYFLSPEGAETFPDLLVRAEKILDLIKKNYSDKNILLVTHGDIGKMIYARFYNLEWKDTLISFHFGNSEVLILDKESKPEERILHKVLQHNH